MSFRMDLTAHKPGEDKPILHFRSRLFKELDKMQESLKLDLFWSISLKDEDDSRPVFYLPEDNSDDEDFHDSYVYPVRDLEPLLAFQNLKVLQLTGLMRTYQPLIWQAVWSNENLSVLHLEMSLSPLFNTTSTHPNRLITCDWTIFPSMTTPRSSTTSFADWSLISANDASASDNEDDAPEPAYLGNNGTGRLARVFGRGEYLDDLAIKNALVAANNNGALAGSYRRFLSVKELTLMNFVVDGIPFVNWFDPAKLRKVTFKGGCVDAGFYLHESMKNVTLVVPPSSFRATGLAKAMEVHKMAEAFQARASQLSALKMIDLKGGKVVSGGGEAAVGGKKKLRGLLGKIGSIRGKSE